MELVLECRQCGGPIALQETDHLVTCGYCNVSTYLAGSDYFRLTLPARPGFDELLQVPYLHFRGCLYSCTEKGVAGRIGNHSLPGVTLPFLPPNLSVRTQALPMRFAAPSTGNFLGNRLTTDKVLAWLGRNMSPVAGTVFHQALIGESVQLVYLPIARRGRKFFDAVAGTPLPGTADEAEEDVAALREPEPAWRLHQLATICPGCGWNLEGPRDTNVLFCRNCVSAWWFRDGRFNPLVYTLVPSRRREVLYLPFWRIEAAGSPLPLASHADLIRLTNQPRVVQPDWEGLPLRFWAPAFKIRPDLYLQLAARLTLAKPEFDQVEALPAGELPSVTLPQGEAIQSLVPILANLTVNRREVYPALPELAFAIGDVRLYLLPFLTSGYELHQEQTGVLVNRRALEYGRAL
ncbi:hypothetical protein [Desulfurivibrio alkaliphilus]|uniref:Uncharacterized protein n=1 Tax=Desulfurivibrio alkaliphilus (strain DSM 19089 / UNIQEM U267 / AHT2) TaxID=589865 RepID=D6Z0W7_DESAT|nr:hypothetical protein [Desulfurivibrio alkaliphilus]ADH87227.1 conserved hypothetical protein [Desulfurivibrio alkaliphilus AHT 2]